MRSRVSCASMLWRGRRAWSQPFRQCRSRTHLQRRSRLRRHMHLPSRTGGSKSRCRAVCRCGWMRRWMGLHCGGCWPPWNGHDRGTTWRSGLSRLRCHRHETRHGGTCHAGAADPVTGPFRWRRVCVPRQTGLSYQSSMARWHRPVGPLVMMPLQSRCRSHMVHPDGTHHQSF